MENVPRHEDVKASAEAIAAERGGVEYELACEHSHSCCVLLAKTSKFKVNGKWHTWIDYEKFQDMVRIVLAKYCIPQVISALAV
jgi:tRNA wybutosine-synthesizing protein 1